jgi:hypothetical protein
MGAQGGRSGRSPDPARCLSGSSASAWGWWSWAYSGASGRTTIGDNDLEHLWGILAVLAAGGEVVGIFTDVTPLEAQYAVAQPDATFVLAGEQEQVTTIPG